MARIADENHMLSDLTQSEEGPETPKDPSVVKFYRQVQAAVLVGNVIDLVYGSNTISDHTGTRFQELDMLLRLAMEKMLKIETSNPRSVSEGLAMTRR